VAVRGRLRTIGLTLFMTGDTKRRIREAGAALDIRVAGRTDEYTMYADEQDEFDARTDHFFEVHDVFHAKRDYETLGGEGYAFKEDVTAVLNIAGHICKYKRTFYPRH